MKVFDEDGNFLGEFISNEFENTKEKVSDSFDSSMGSGCLTLLLILSLKFPFLLIIVVLWLILKLLWNIIKFILRILWWILRFPFYLIFKKEFPEF